MNEGDLLAPSGFPAQPKPPLVMTKNFKCVLAPHHNIPQPILSILVGRIPKVSTVIQDVSEQSTADESKLDDDNKDDQGRVKPHLLLLLFPFYISLLSVVHSTLT